MAYLNSNRLFDRPLTVLIVGAAGQTAREVIFALTQLDPAARILAGVRDRAKGEVRLTYHEISLDTFGQSLVQAGASDWESINLG